MLEKKQLLTLIGLEVWDKLLVIRNLSCQTGKRQDIKRTLLIKISYCDLVLHISPRQLVISYISL